jgi:hypothetical protein
MIMYFIVFKRKPGKPGPYGNDHCGAVEKAQQMANHSDPRTTKLHDRRRDEVSLDEVERI